MNLNEKLQKYLFKGEKLNLGFKNKKLIDIKGRNAFRVAIICERKRGKDGKKSKEYYITVDDANQFKQDYQNGIYSFSKANKIEKIRITGKSKKEIMKEIKSILELSNIDLMKKFNITDLGNSFLPIALLVDDTVQEHFESEEEWDSESENIDNDEKKLYWYDYRIIVRDNNCVSVLQSYKNDVCYLIILKKSNGETKCTDWLKYKIQEGQIEMDIRKLSSELGEQILQMLQERFEVKMIVKKEEQNEGREANSNTPNGHATLVNACMMSKSSDLKKAGESIIEGHSTDIQGQNQIK